MSTLRPHLIALTLLLTACGGPPLERARPTTPRIERARLSWQPTLDAAPPPLRVTLDLTLPGEGRWFKLEAPPSLQLEGAKREGEGWRFDPPLPEGPRRLTGALPAAGARLLEGAEGPVLLVEAPEGWGLQAPEISLEIQIPEGTRALSSHPAEPTSGGVTADISRGPIAWAIGELEPVAGGRLFVSPGEAERAQAAAARLPGLLERLGLATPPRLIAVEGASGGAGGLRFLDARLLLVDESTASPRRLYWSARLLAGALIEAGLGAARPLPAGLSRYLTRALVADLTAEMGLEPGEAARDVRRLALKPDAPAAQDPLTFEILAAQSDVKALISAAKAWAADPAADLAALLEAHTGLGVGRALAARGVEVLDVTPRCEAKLARLERAPYPRGAAASNAPLPVCLRYALKGQPAQRACAILEGETLDVPLPGCPEWLHPNADQRGRYLWRVEGGAGAALRHLEALTPRERGGLVANLEALFRGGLLDAEGLLDAAFALATQADPDVLDALIGLLPTLAEACPEAARPKLGAWARALLAPHLTRLAARKARSEAEGRLYRRALFAAAHLGAHEGTFARAEAEMKRFLAEAPRGPDADALLPIAAWRGDAALWRRLEGQLEGAAPLRRVDLLRALGSFRGPAEIRETLDLLLDGAIQPHELRIIIRGVQGEARAAARAWVLGRRASLAGLPPEARAGLAWLADDLCGQREEAEGYLAALTPDLITAEVAAAVRLKLDRCAALRALQGRALEAALSR